MLVFRVSKISPKKVFFNTQGWDKPTMYYSEKLKALYRHVRHPIFTAPILLLSCTLVMTLDRFILVLLCVLPLTNFSFFPLLCTSLLLLM